MGGNGGNGGAMGMGDNAGAMGGNGGAMGMGVEPVSDTDEDED